MKIAVIDIETTNFLNNGGKIVEVGIVELDLTNGNKTVLMNFVTHENGITEIEIDNSWIIKNSDLTKLQIRYSINLSLILKQIQTIADTYPCTAFNRRFDTDFLTSRGIIFNNLYPCPMLELTPIMKLPSKRGNKWPNVEEAYKYFFPDTEYVEQHRALDDALHEADIIYELHKLKTNGKV